MYSVLWLKFFDTELKSVLNLSLSLSLFSVVHRKGEHKINLIASNPLNDPEETSIIVQVTDSPTCYPPAVTMLGLNGGKVDCRNVFIDKPY